MSLYTYTYIVTNALMCVLCEIGILENRIIYIQL